MIHILDEKKIKSNYEMLIKLIDDTFSGERKDALMSMYDELQDTIIMAPASSHEHYNNAFAGGYVDHVLRVTNNALQLYELFDDNDMIVDDYDTENVIFVGLHHGLGKIGDGKNPWYLPNDSDWHVQHQGKIYITNPDMHHMTINDRTMWLLQKYYIEMSEIEFLGIKLSSGLYDSSNSSYLKNIYEKGKMLKSNLPTLIHMASMMAVRFEQERWLKQSNEPITSGNSVIKNKGGRPSKNKNLKDKVSLKSTLDFDSIFKDGD